MNTNTSVQQAQALILTRRQVATLTAATLLLAYHKAHGFTLNDITQKEASTSVKTLLEKGALAAVLQLGRVDGFLGNEQVRIGLPGKLEEAGKLLSKLGQSKKVEELVVAMNRGAELAVPLAKNLLVGAVRGMTVVDAKNILTGGETSVTEFFSSKTRAPLALQFLPIVTKATAKVGLAEKYNNFAGKLAPLGVVHERDANIQNYVTHKALDGLYSVIGQQERAFRADPAKAGSAVLSKVLGALR